MVSPPDNPHRQGEFGELGKQGAAVTKKGILTVVTEARDRHSVLQVAAPHELDEDDPVQLRDPQTCQVPCMLASLTPCWV